MKFLDELAARLPKIPDRWFALFVVVAVGYFSGARVVEYAIGAWAGGILVWIWLQPRPKEGW